VSARCRANEDNSCPTAMTAFSVARDGFERGSRGYSMFCALQEDSRENSSGVWREGCVDGGSGHEIERDVV
jgi:hypothetical protein